MLAHRPPTSAFAFDHAAAVAAYIQRTMAAARVRLIVAKLRAVFPEALAVACSMAFIVEAIGFTHNMRPSSGAGISLIKHTLTQQECPLMRGCALLVDVGRDIAAIVQDIACMASDDDGRARIVGVHASSLSAVGKTTKRNEPSVGSCSMDVTTAPPNGEYVWQIVSCTMAHRSSWLICIVVLLWNLIINRST